MTENAISKGIHSVHSVRGTFVFTGNKKDFVIIIICVHDNVYI